MSLFEVTQRQEVKAEARIVDIDGYLHYVSASLAGHWNLPDDKALHLGYYDVRRVIVGVLNESTETVTKAGNLGKRISKAMKLEHGVKLTTYHLEVLGNAVLTYGTGGDFIYDITDTFDWKAGDFGDHGSCFWQGRAAARTILAKCDARAIRFFSPSGKGTGRAWVLPDPREDAWLVFNAYGTQLSLVGRRLTSIYPETFVQKVGMYINGDHRGVLYVNNAAALAVTEDERLAKKDTWDVNLRISVTMCTQCGTFLDEDEGQEVYYDDGNAPYCESCHARLFFTCDHCGEEHHDIYRCQVNVLPNRRTPRYNAVLRDWCSGCLDDVLHDGRADNLYNGYFFYEE